MGFLILKLGIGNFVTFLWILSSSINLLFLKSDVGITKASIVGKEKRNVLKIACEIRPIYKPGFFPP